MVDTILLLLLLLLLLLYIIIIMGYDTNNNGLNINILWSITINNRGFADPHPLFSVTGIFGGSRRDRNCVIIAARRAMTESSGTTRNGIWWLIPRLVSGL